jgi:hypothetical protein
VTLLLAEFANLLKLDMGSNDFFNKLPAHIPPIADALLSWSDDKATQGLWAKLGFGQRSQLSAAFRLFCKIQATFLATRIIQQDAESSKSNLIEDLQCLKTFEDYKDYSVQISQAVELIKSEEHTLIHWFDFLRLFHKELCQRDYNLYRIR